MLLNKFSLIIKCNYSYYKYTILNNKKFLTLDNKLIERIKKMNECKKFSDQLLHYSYCINKSNLIFSPT